MIQPPQSGQLPKDLTLLKIAELFRERSGWKMSDRDWGKFTTAINARMNFLRIWSAGCSTGEEAYSLAILIRSLLPDFIDWKIIILGTDISSEAIQKARLGLFKENSLRDIPLKDRSMYFSKQGDQWLLDSK